MKIVNLDEFLQFPVGTVFMKYEPVVFEELCIKHTSSIKGDSKDFYYKNISSEVECSGSDEYSDILYSAERTKESVKLDLDCISRDGLFNEKQLFAIYESEDVIKLIDVLTKTLK